MKLLHTSITVKDIEASIKFYQEILGLELLSRRGIPENNAEIAFLGEKTTDHRIEMTFWRGKQDYVEGDQLDHIAFEVENMDEAISLCRRKNVTITKEPYTLKGSTRRIAFIKDPNGIWLELIEK